MQHKNICIVFQKNYKNDPKDPDVHRIFGQILDQFKNLVKSTIKKYNFAKFLRSTRTCICMENFILAIYGEVHTLYSTCIYTATIKQQGYQFPTSILLLA